MHPLGATQRRDRQSNILSSATKSWMSVGMAGVFSAHGGPPLASWWGLARNPSSSRTKASTLLQLLHRGSSKWLGRFGERQLLFVHGSLSESFVDNLSSSMNPSWPIRQTTCMLPFTLRPEALWFGLVRSGSPPAASSPRPQRRRRPTLVRGWACTLVWGHCRGVWNGH